MQQYEKDHRALVLDNAAECTVLLKNDGKFPLGRPGKLAAYGAGVISKFLELGYNYFNLTLRYKTWLRENVFMSEGL